MIDRMLTFFLMCSQTLCLYCVCVCVCVRACVRARANAHCTQKRGLCVACIHMHAYKYIRVCNTIINMSARMHSCIYSQSHLHACVSHTHFEIFVYLYACVNTQKKYLSLSLSLPPPSSIYLSIYLSFYLHLSI